MNSIYTIILLIFLYVILVHKSWFLFESFESTTTIVENSELDKIRIKKMYFEEFINKVNTNAIARQKFANEKDTMNDSSLKKLHDILQDLKTTKTMVDTMKETGECQEFDKYYSYAKDYTMRICKFYNMINKCYKNRFDHTFDEPKIRGIESILYDNLFTLLKNNRVVEMPIGDILTNDNEHTYDYKIMYGNSNDMSIPQDFFKLDNIDNIPSNELELFLEIVSLKYKQVQLEIQRNIDDINVKISEHNINHCAQNENTHDCQDDNLLNLSEYCRQ